MWNSFSIFHIFVELLFYIFGLKNALIALQHVICTAPSEVDYRYACTTKLHVLVGIVGDVRYSGQILTDELP